MSFPKQSLIAIVGASMDSQKYGHKIMVDLLAAGYTVVGINPKGGTVKGHTLETNLESLPQAPELVIIVVPPQIGVQVLHTCKELGIPEVWMQPGAESQEAIQFAQENKLHLTTNTCFMKQEGLW